MNKINEDFMIPFYIVEELIDYIELTSKGYSKYAKWNNIKSLLKLAQVNNRLSNEQVNFIINKYNRE